MVRSMTGYGRAHSIAPWLVEIHSVNRKTLDVSIYIPREYLRFEIEMRKWIAEVVSRGQVTVRIQVPPDASEQMTVATLHALKNFWEKVAKTLGYNPQEEVSLNFLTKQMGNLSQEIPEDQIREVLRKGVQEALDALQVMKKHEGSALQQDIEQRLHLIEDSLNKISLRGPEIRERSREKIQEKLKELAFEAKEAETRLIQELALLAERADITEELTRLHSHINQFLGCFKQEEKSLGRRLDFLAQEMHREINTIASKSADVSITQEVIAVKSEIEKIREQVQNIE